MQLLAYHETLSIVCLVLLHVDVLFMKILWAKRTSPSSAKRTPMEDTPKLCEDECRVHFKVSTYKLRNIFCDKAQAIILNSML